MPKQKRRKKTSSEFTSLEIRIEIIVKIRFRVMKAWVWATKKKLISVLVIACTPPPEKFNIIMQSYTNL
jgi:hypothetical protein